MDTYTIMKFADYAKVYLTAGNGGAGSVSFRREKYVPHGGPDGGDGGKGGDITIRGNAQMNTILDLRYRKFIKAKHGQNGAGSNKSGKNADDIILEVPLGTVAYEADTRRLLGEVTEDGQMLVLAAGGIGGKGNAFFKTSVNQSPEHAQPGMPGVEIVVELELKLIADVGLVGFPNAGKSTLLAAVSAAKPKIADYPFTTLEPNLGVVTFPDYRSFVMADIPGIIEDAHEGKGLGLQFLRHIERNRALLFVISCQTDIRATYDTLIAELEAYNPELLDKPRLIAVTQLDLYPGYELPDEPDLPDEWIGVSAVTGHNMTEMKEHIWQLIQSVPK
jgi:GTP-binding protein